MPGKKKDSHGVKIPKLPTEKKQYNFSLSLPGLVSAAGSGVLVITFFFVMGILIGRGYRPEADVPQLSQIMPAKEHGQLSEERPAKPEILKAEELDYPDRLKASPEKVMEQPAPKPEPVKTPPKPEKPQAAAVESKPEKPQAAPAAPAKPGEKVYDYVYQAAAFKQAAAAENFSAKLAAAGLRTSISSGTANGTTWHRVNVLHRGTPPSTNDMRAKLKQFGIQKPLMKEKTLAQ